MDDMATLLDRAMATPDLDQSVLALDATIAGMVDRVVACVRPAAAEAGVELIVEVQREVRTIPSGARVSAASPRQSRRALARRCPRRPEFRRLRSRGGGVPAGSAAGSNRSGILHFLRKLPRLLPMSDGGRARGMKPRMMCTDCFRTAEADTVLEGSDLAEIVAWCFFAVPGLLYCWWRHALRIKVCPFCGSDETTPLATFGSLLMTSQYYCRSCKTTFEWVRREQEPRQPRAH